MSPALPAAYRAKIARESWTNFSVLRHGGFDGVLVTSKNSGTHWIKYMLAVALAETYGVPPPRYFSEGAVRAYIGWPKDKPTFPELPKLAFCHSIPHRLADWRWARAVAGLPPYVLAVRHPMSILASHYEKWRGELGVDWLTYLKGDPVGARYRCDLYWISRLWNRWGDLIAKYPDAICKITYEDTEIDPRAVLERMARQFNLSLTPASLDAAILAGTKTAMANRIDPAAEPNVLQNRAEPLTQLFAGEALAIYCDQTARLFRRGLGYNLTAIPQETTA
jgi:hypothetical protein